jgi:hypothetical protein
MRFIRAKMKKSTKQSGKRPTGRAGGGKGTRSLTTLASVDPALARRLLLTFGKKDKASRWLHSKVLALGGLSPLEVLAAGERSRVLQILGRIDHGTYS